MDYPKVSNSTINFLEFLYSLRKELVKNYSVNEEFFQSMSRDFFLIELF
jgi:hypothetical protein